MNIALNVTISLSTETLEVFKLLVAGQKVVGTVNPTKEVPGNAKRPSSIKVTEKGELKKEEEVEKPAEVVNDAAEEFSNDDTEGGVVTAEAVTVEKLRALTTEKIQGGKRNEVIALLTKYEAKKVPELDKKHYAAYLKELQAL